MRTRICLRSRARCRLLTRPLPSPLPPPTQEEQGPTVLTCLRPPVSHTAWSTGRSRWTCAASVRTADSRPRSPARCSTTLAASAPTMRMRSGGRFGLISLASKPLKTLVPSRVQFGPFLGSHFPRFAHFPAVPHRPGLLHRQGAADHRADVREGLGGGDRGKRRQDRLSSVRVWSCSLLWGGKH